MDNRNLNSAGTTLSAATYFAVQTHEAAEDFLLPDYMPAVRRIVSVEATALPETRFLTGSALEFGGTVSYAVLYIGEGGELYSAPLTTEYTASAALAENAIVDATSVGVDTVAETVTCRVTAPRRLTLKCRMKTKIAALLPQSTEGRVLSSDGGRITPADELCIERLVATADDTSFCRGEATATLEGILPTSDKVIRCSGAVRVDEATAGAGAVTVRGEVVLTALCLSPEGTYFRTAAKTPFTETVTVPGAEAGDGARAWGRFAAVTVSSTERGAAFEVEYDLEAECAHTAMCAYTADMFSTDCATDVSYKETDTLKLLRCGQSALSISGVGGRQSKATVGETVLDTHAVCTPERMERKENRLILHGSCAVTVLLLSEGDVIAEEFTLPLRYECECPPSGEDLLWRCLVDTVSAAARPEGDKLAVQLELCLSMSVLAKGRVRYAESATLQRDKMRVEDDGCIRICYPMAGESLWEIAKRYGVSRQTLRAENGIPETEEKCDGAPILL